MKKIKLGLAPTRRFCFSVEDAHKYKKLVEKKLTDWEVDFINIDSINKEGLLIGADDSKKASELFKKEKVDAVFSPHVNFGTEEIVSRLAKDISKPFLLWGPRDEKPLEGGVRLRDTQCGLFATSNVLNKYRVPFTYIINSRVDSKTFERGFKNFMRSANVVKNFMKARIGQISTRPANFYTVIINEQELLSRWGIEIVPITLLQVVNTMKMLIKKDKRVKEEVREIRNKIQIDPEVTEESLEKIAALKIFMLDWAESEDLSAIAIKCHDDLPDETGIYSCFANGELTGLGIPVACETDIHGAISSIILQNSASNEASIFFADLTVRHPENNNAELLWHCGNFPYKLSSPNCRNCFISGHPIIPPHRPGPANFELKPGNITVARFDGMNGEYSLFMGQGKSTEGPQNFGTYLWFEVPDWKMW
ncbi:MAG: L-fucose/L-arabinose isomerase family protein, partial [Candidatus Humimicrobiaceae bacterium]